MTDTVTPRRPARPHQAGPALRRQAGRWLLAAVIALSVWLARTGRRPRRIGLAMALGGGLGNLLEHIVNGAITDWIHLDFYTATFNPADIAVRAGLILALIDLVSESYARRPRPDGRT